METSNQESRTANIISMLNDLLINLSIPFTIISPSDLTPRLLLAVLESLLHERLPINPLIRECATSKTKLQAMKVFLGVLETDVLRVNIGLCDIDPRRLANTELEEVLFIGELLCWLGRRSHGVGADERFGFTDIAPPLNSKTSQRPLSPHSTITNSVNTDLSLRHASVPGNSDTSIITSAESYSGSNVDSFSSGLNLHMTPQPSHLHIRSPPRCIHEVEDPFSPHFDFPYSSNEVSLQLDRSPLASHEQFSSTYKALSPSTGPSVIIPVRYTGWINLVDEDLEISSFESSRSDLHSGRNITEDLKVKGRQNQRISVGNASDSHLLIGYRTLLSDKPDDSPIQYTLELLSQRANLLEELAELQNT